jgi:SAM-dependent methyltransferase
VPGLFRYVECTDCGTVFQDPRVRDEDLPLCYPQDYYTHAGGAAWSPTPAPPGSLRARLRQAIRDGADGTAASPRSPLLRAAGRLLALSPDLRRRARLGLADPLASPPRGRCLEVGPGPGVDLYCLRELGWEACGLEADPIAAERARLASGCEVRVGTLASTDYPAEHFDLTYMRHVFEHLPDPVRSLRRCLELLRPGGRLVLLYPNPRALTARYYRSQSPVWDPPRHLVLPPVRAILQIVARSGFVDARAGTLSAQASVNAGAARRRRRGLTWDPATPGSPSLVDRAFALAESFLVGLGRPVGEEVLLHARKPLAAA